MRNNKIIKTYNDFISNKFINYDEGQKILLNKICSIWKDTNKINLFSRSKKFNGIYVYGSVGIGKTFILNLFTK